MTDHSALVTAGWRKKGSLEKRSLVRDDGLEAGGMCLTVTGLRGHIDAAGAGLTLPRRATRVR